MRQEELFFYSSCNYKKDQLLQTPELKGTWGLDSALIHNAVAPTGTSMTCLCAWAFLST